MSFRVEEEGVFRATVRFQSISLPNVCIDNSHVKIDANISASKLEHQHRATYAQESETAATDEKRVIHGVKGTTGTIKSFAAGCVTPCVGDATVLIDLLRNGTSVLVAPFTLSSSESAYEWVDGVVDTEAVVADDVLSVEITGSAGTGTLGEGVMVMLDVFEDVE